MTEEKKLKWTDLKVGDVVRHKVTGIEHLIVGIDKNTIQIIIPTSRVHGFRY